MTLPGESAPVPPAGHRRFSLRTTFTALRHRNYRLWFGGQLVSLLGTWMQGTAQGFLVFELTSSPAYLGYVGFAGGIPAWLFTLYGGVMADRVPRRTLLLATQVALMTLALALAALTFAGLVQPWHILLFAFGHGTAIAFDAPARQAFVVEMVDREDLTNAIALNSTIFNSATTLGPAVAGVVYALVGPAWCFAANAISYLAVIAALLLMRLPQLPARVGRRTVLAELLDGLRFAVGHRVIRLLIATEGAVSLLGVSVITLMPAWAVRVLHGHARTNGLLLSARGLGSLVGALLIASLGRFRGRGRLLELGSLLLPLLLLAFAVARALPLSLLALTGVGFGVIVLFNTLNALVQSHVPDDLRGRVMSIYTLTFFGLMPLGSLVAGSLAARIGEPPTVMITATALLLLALVVRLSLPWVRELE